MIYTGLFAPSFDLYTSIYVCTKSSDSFYKVKYLYKFWPVSMLKTKALSVYISFITTRNKWFCLPQLHTNKICIIRCTFRWPRIGTKNSLKALTVERVSVNFEIIMLQHYFWSFLRYHTLARSICLIT